MWTENVRFIWIQCALYVGNANDLKYFIKKHFKYWNIYTGNDIHFENEKKKSEM